LKINEIKNVKVGLYQENIDTYMSLEFDCKADEDYTCKVLRLDLSYLTLQLDYESGRSYVEIPIRAVNGKYAEFIKIDNPKEMSVEEIEKELGYKIKIKN
jgi:hypothetical protein